MKTFVSLIIEPPALDQLSTKLIQGRKKADRLIYESINKLRCERIDEAINWRGGTIEEPNPIQLTLIKQGIPVFFKKPGKEANPEREENKKPHDMTPMVGDSYIDATFDEIWFYLIKLSFVDNNDFRKLLVLIYRNAFLLDHKKINGILIYAPSSSIALVINDLGKKFDDHLPNGGVIGLLHFLDLLGWNEDVKYHYLDYKPVLKGTRVKIGRINNMLSCITVAQQMNIFMKEVINNAKDPVKIDYHICLDIMQRLLKSGGVCPPTNPELLSWLKPYVHE